MQKTENNKWDDQKTVRERIKEEKRKLSGLSFPEKIRYLWDYYKYLIAVGIGIIILISIGVTIWENHNRTYVLQAYIVNGNSQFVDEEKWKKEFAEVLGGTDAGEEIVIDSSISYDDEELIQYSMGGKIKLLALMSASDIDVLILEQDGYEEYAKEGAFEDLGGLLSEEQKEEWEPYLTGCTAQKKEAVNYGINLKDSPVLDLQNLYPDQNGYAAIVMSGKNKENAVRFLEYLLEGKKQ